MNISHSIIWIDGRFTETDQFSVSPFDAGFTVGEGIFETLKGLNGKVFALQPHMARLTDGANVFDFAAPKSTLVDEVFCELMDRNHLTEAKLRLTLTRENLLMTASPLPEFPASMSVVTLPYCRNERDILAGVKSTSYGQNILALKFARDHQADEAIFGNTAGNLCEGSCTNIFVKYGDQWFTPPLSAGPLAGVTRDLVLQLAKSIDIQIFEQDTELSKLAGAREAFLTSSLRDVMPISSIDDTRIRSTEETEQIRDNFQHLLNDI